MDKPTIANLDAPTMEERMNLAEYNLWVLTQAVVNMQEVLIATGAAQIRSGSAQPFPGIMGDPEREIPIAGGGTIKVKDIPLSPEGLPDEAWSMQYCPCEKHEELRQAARKSLPSTVDKKADDEPRNIGQYL